MYLHQKMIRIYADIIQNPTFLGRFQTFGGQCTLYYYYNTNKKVLAKEYYLQVIKKLL